MKTLSKKIPVEIVKKEGWLNMRQKWMLVVLFFAGLIMVPTLATAVDDVPSCKTLWFNTYYPKNGETKCDVDPGIVEDNASTIYEGWWREESYYRPNATNGFPIRGFNMATKSYGDKPLPTFHGIVGQTYSNVMETVGQAVVSQLTYNGNLSQVPVAPSATVTLTIPSASGNYTVSAVANSGILTGDGAGTIDYGTGAFTFTLVGAPGPGPITATYEINSGVGVMNSPRDWVNLAPGLTKLTPSWGGGELNNEVGPDGKPHQRYSKNSPGTHALLDGFWTPGERFHDQQRYNVAPNAEWDPYIPNEDFWNTDNYVATFASNTVWSVVAVELAQPAATQAAWDAHRGEYYADYYNDTVVNASTTRVMYVGFEQAVDVWIADTVHATNAHYVVSEQTVDLPDPTHPLTIHHVGEGDFTHTVVHDPGAPWAAPANVPLNGEFDYNVDQTFTPLVYPAFANGSGGATGRVYVSYQSYLQTGAATPYLTYQQGSLIPDYWVIPSVQNGAGPAPTPPTPPYYTDVSGVSVAPLIPGTVILCNIHVPVYQAGELWGQLLGADPFVSDQNWYIDYDYPNYKVFPPDNQWTQGLPPEPFEDFISWWIPNGGNPGAGIPKGAWLTGVIGCPWAVAPAGAAAPFMGGTDPYSTLTWDEYQSYILNNYPGDTNTLIHRAGNGIYDGPDDWVSVTTIDNSKLQQHGFIFNANMPSTAYPGSYGLSGWDYYGTMGGNWDSWWKINYAATTAGASPGWQNMIPDMSPWAGNPTNAYVSMPTVVTNLVNGHGVIGTNWTEVVYPPMGSTWGYKSPQEYDDLASSMYHVGGGPEGTSGDLRPGESTSPWTWGIYGQDMGEDNPYGANVTPDYVYPACGPMAYNVYGADGLDAGNELNIEWLTWRTDGTCLTGPKGGGTGSGLAQPQYTRDHRDVNLDGLMDIGETVPPNSLNYSVDTNPQHPAGGRLTDYPFKWTRYFEDCTAAWDTTEDFNALAHNNTTGTNGDIQIQAPSGFIWTDGTPYTAYLQNVLWRQNPAIPHAGFDPTLDDMWICPEGNGIFNSEIVLNKPTTNSLIGASGTDFLPKGLVKYFDMNGDGQFTVGTDFAWYDANNNNKYDTDVAIQDPTGWMAPGEAGNHINWRQPLWAVCYQDVDGVPGPSAGDNFWLTTNNVLTAFNVDIDSVIYVGNPGVLTNGAPGTVVGNALYYSRQGADAGPVIGANGDDIWVDNNPSSPNDGIFTAEQAVHAPHGLAINTIGKTVGVVSNWVAYVSDVAGPYQRVYDDAWWDANGDHLYNQDTIILDNSGTLAQGTPGVVPPSPIAWRDMPDLNGNLDGVYTPLTPIGPVPADTYYGSVVWMDVNHNGTYEHGTSYTIQLYCEGWASSGIADTNMDEDGGGGETSTGVNGLSIGPHVAHFAFNVPTRDNMAFSALAQVFPASAAGFGTLTHEQGHDLIGWPDYYDYNVWGIDQGVNHHPIGKFDLMSNGGLVHGIGSTKVMAGWVQPQPLNVSLLGTPLLGAPDTGIHTLLLYPVERFPDQYYYFFNSDPSTGSPIPNQGEDFCFYYEDGESPYSTVINHQERGVYINHDCNGAMPTTGHPLQQRIDNHFTWEMVEADGLYRMEDGTSLGDAQCIWRPGVKTVFNEYSQPPARWWDQSVAGIRITDIRPSADSDPWGPCEVDFEWFGTSGPWYWVAPGGAANAEAAAAGAGAAGTNATWGTLVVPLATGATWNQVPQWQYNSGTVANPMVSVENVAPAPYTWTLTQNQSGSTTLSGAGVQTINYTAGTNAGVDMVTVTAQSLTTLDPSTGTNIVNAMAQPVTSTIEFDVGGAVGAGAGAAGSIPPQFNAAEGIVSPVQGIGLAANGCYLGAVAGGERGDSDNDGIPDAWEIYWFNRYATSPGDEPSVLAVANGTSDWDGDGLPDYAEWLAHLNPIDQWSWSQDANRTLTDADADIAGSHISNLDKYNAGLNIREPDSDNDGISDADEMNPNILKPDQTGPNGVRKVTSPLYSRSPLIERSLHVSAGDQMDIPSYQANDYHRFELPVWTVEAWVKLDTASETGTILYRQTAQGFTNFVLGVKNNVPYAGFTTEGGNSYIAYSATPLNANEWHHLAGVFNDTNNTLRLYLDGSLTNSLQVLEIPAIGHPILLAGQTMTGFVKLGGGFNGFVDETRIWASSRNDTQLAFGYNKIINSPWLPGVLWVNKQSYNFTLKSSLGNDGTLVSNLRFDDGMNTTITNLLDGTVHRGGVSDWVHPLGANEGTYWNGGDRTLTFGYSVQLTGTAYLTTNSADVINMHLITNTDQPIDDVNEDGIADWWQIMYWPDFNPTTNGAWDASADPDGDGFTNLQEYQNDTNPRDPTNIHIGPQPPPPPPGPTNTVTDTDGDGLPDWWEIKYGLDPTSAIGVNGPWGDPDHDGMCNWSEYLAGTDPQNPNTTGGAFLDFDTVDPLTGLTYGWEYANSDGIPPLWKFNYNLSPMGYEADNDPDRDGWDNYNEYMAGTNPKNNTSVPQPPLDITAWYAGYAAGNLIVQAYSTATMDGTPDAVITMSTGALGMAPQYPLTFTANSATNGVSIPSNGWGAIEYIMAAGDSFDAVPSWWYNVGTIMNPVQAIETVAPPPYTWTLTQNQSGSTTLGGAGVAEIDYIAGPNSGVDVITVTAQGTVTLDANGFPVVHANPQTVTSTIYMSINGAGLTMTSGYVREGDNWFFTFIDVNGNGTWDPGEPCGYAVYQPINMTWGAAPVDIELQDYAQGFPRFSWTPPTGVQNTRVLVEYRQVVGVNTNYTTVLDTTLRAPRNYITEADVVRAGQTNGLLVANGDWQPVYRYSEEFNPPNGAYVPSSTYLTFTQTWASAVNVTPVIVYPNNETVNLLPLQLEWTSTDQTAAFKVEIRQGSTTGPVVFSSVVRAPYYFDNSGQAHYIFRPQWLGSQYLQLADGVYYWHVEVNNNGPHLDSSYSAFSRILLDTTGTSSLDTTNTLALLHAITGELDYFGRVSNHTASEQVLKGTGAAKVFSNKTLTNLVSGASTAEPVVAGTLSVWLNHAGASSNLVVFTDVGANTSNLASVTLVVDAAHTQTGWLASTCTVNYLTGTILSLAFPNAPATNDTVFATYSYQGYPFIIQAYRALDIPGFSGHPVAQISMNTTGIFQIAGLPADTYTLLGFIDQNGNGLLDPTESWGFIRNLVPADGPGYAEIHTVAVGTKTVTLNDNLKLVVRDRDTDNDKLPDAWEVQQYGSIQLHSGDELVNGIPLWLTYEYAALPSIVSMLLEVNAGFMVPGSQAAIVEFLTSSTSTNTQFVIPTFSTDASGNPVLTWNSPDMPANTLVQYVVLRNPSLIGGTWTAIGEVDALPGQAAQSRTYVDNAPGRPAGAFYRLQATVSYLQQ